MEGIELYNEDCFNIFPEIKDKYIDLFILDLPYNVTSLNWDKDIINLDKMWVEIKRIMKPNAIIIFFCTAKFGYKLIHSNPKWFRYDLIWKKSRRVGFLSCNRRQLRAHENIYIFKDKQGTYNPQKTDGKEYNKYRPTQNITTIDGAYGKIFKANTEQKVNDRFPTSIIDHENIYIFKDKQGTYNPQKTEGKKNHSQGKGKNSSVNPQKQKLYGKTNGLKKATELTTQKHPTSIIENTILQYNNPHKTIHRTQKPVELYEWLIKTYSNEDDIVMDFTMGSGSCGIASINTKRKFIGVEKDNEIFEKAYQRIDNHYFN